MADKTPEQIASENLAAQTAAGADAIAKNKVAATAAIEADLERNPRDESKVAGGLYKRANDPNYYNAEGVAVSKDGKPIKAAE